MTYVVVGAGFAGATCAERLATAGHSVLVVDKRSHVAGNAYDYYDDTGILVSRYGAHCFHTNSQAVVDYLSRFTEWRPYTHRVLSSVNGQLLPVPINTTTLAAFGGDEAAARRAMIEPYTRKQWGPYAEQLSSTVLARIKTRDSDDDRYFTDSFQQMPADGYTRLVARMLTHPNITVRLGTWLAGALLHDAAARDGTEWASDQVIYTGSIDEFFDYRFGRLPYRSARFEFDTLSREWFQPVGVVNYPGEDVSFTRIAEFKHLTGQRHTHTTIVREYPQADGEPFWPVPTESSAALYKQYEALAATVPWVHFVGRLGRYQYLDIHAVVAQALKVSKQLVSRNSVTQKTGSLCKEDKAMAKTTETSPQPRVVEMDWPDAQRAILNGKKLRRRSWANEELYMVMTDGWLKHRTASGEMHQLTVCEADLLATDWVILRDN